MGAQQTLNDVHLGVFDFGQKVKEGFHNNVHDDRGSLEKIWGIVKAKWDRTQIISKIPWKRTLTHLNKFKEDVFKTVKQALPEEPLDKIKQTIKNIFHHFHD